MKPRFISRATFVAVLCVKRQLAPAQTERGMPLFMLHTGDFHSCRILIVDDQMREPAKAGPAQAAWPMNVGKSLRLLADFPKPELEIIPEAIGGG